MKFKVGDVWVYSCQPDFEVILIIGYRNNNVDIKTLYTSSDAQIGHIFNVRESLLKNLCIEGTLKLATDFEKVLYL